MVSRKLRRSSAATALLACCTLAASGCLDIQTTTVVHRDESLTRTVLFSGDSASIPPARAILGIDSAWTLESGRTEKTHTLRAERRFADIGEMSRAVEGNLGETVRIVPRLDTRFNWFFTTYRYSETWRRLHAVDDVPLSEYVSAGEIAMFYRHELEKEPYATRGDSLAFADAEDRYREWDERNWFEAYYRVFLAGVHELGDPSLTPDSVAARKEILFRETRGRFGTINDIDSLQDIDAMGAEFARVLKNPRALAAAEARREEIGALAAQQRFVASFTPYGYQVGVEMPGLITNTNANSVNGSQVLWKGFEGALYITDYDMWVESSVVNWWAIIISALLLIAAVVFAIAVIIRGRRVVPAA